MLHYDTRGSGDRPVILLHGFLGSGRNLSSLGRRLAEADPSIRVILPDLRGHGISPPLTTDADLATLASDVVELIGELQGDEPVDVLGHSLGGRVALVALSLSPRRLGRVVLLDIAPGPLPSLHGPMQRLFERLMGAPPTAPDRETMRRFFIDGSVDQGLTDWVLTNLLVSDEGVSWRIDRAALARLHWQETPADLWPIAEAHGKVIEVLYGESSRFVGPEAVERLKAAGSQVTAVAKAGHFLHVDALERTVQLLTCRPKAER